jgi:hypothetical protein
LIFAMSIARMVNPLALFILLLAACATTHVTRVRDPEYVGRRFMEPAVYAATRELDVRQLFEDAMVSTLAKAGVRAHSTLELVPPTREYTPEERLGILERAGVDSLIVISGESGVDSVYIPVTGSTTTTVGSAQVSGNQVDFRATSDTHYLGGYYAHHPWARITTEVIDLDASRTAWIGTSTTRGNVLASLDDVRKSYAIAVVKRIEGDRLFSHPARDRSRDRAPPPIAPKLIERKADDVIRPVPTAAGDALGDVVLDECIPATQCCKICRKERACGNACVSANDACQVERGCACNAEEICD